MRRVLTVALVLVVTSLALVSSGCMGDDSSETSSPTEWADALCAAVSTWTNELQQIGTEITSSPTNEALQQAAADLDTATTAFVDDVQGLGGPGTEGGDEIEDAIQVFADTAEEEKAEVQEAVDDIDDAEGATGIAGALGVAGASIQAMGGALQTMLQTFEGADAGGELEAAFEEAESCRQLGE
jgi:hypothetical protein